MNFNMVLLSVSMMLSSSFLHAKTEVSETTKTVKNTAPQPKQKPLEASAAPKKGDQKSAKDSACKVIEAECLKVGYRVGGAGEGLGLVTQCLEPILGKGKQGKLPLPKIFKPSIDECKKEKGIK
jgi:hypothetical protein